MDPIFDVTKSAAGLSNGALSLIKKIPLLGDIIRYEERKEQTEQAVHEKFLNEYRILNDPIAQTNFINSFSDETERKAIIGHIIDVRSDAQKSLNIANVLSKFCENVASTDEKDVDDKQMDPDWWMLWLDRVKMTSSPQKQAILAKALELENKKQGSVSARFIRILGDMSSNDLDVFCKYAPYFSAEGHLYSHLDHNFSDDEFYEISLDEQKKLENIFVARFPTGLGEYRSFDRLETAEHKYFALSYLDYVIIIWCEQEKLDMCYSMSLLPEGRLLRSLIGLSSDFEYLKLVAKKISEEKKCRVSIHQAIENRGACRLATCSFNNGKEETGEVGL